MELSMNKDSNIKIINIKLKNINKQMIIKE